MGKCAHQYLFPYTTVGFSLKRVFLFLKSNEGTYYKVFKFYMPTLLFFRKNAYLRSVLFRRKASFGGAD